MSANRLMPADGAAGIRREVQDFVTSSSLPTHSPPPPENQGAAKQSDEIQALIRRWQDDCDKTALDRLCVLHQRMVKAEVRKWWPGSPSKRSKTGSRDQEARLDLEQAAWVGFRSRDEVVRLDLEQAAWVGFIKAVGRYKAHHGATPAGGCGMSFARPPRSTSPTAAASPASTAVWRAKTKMTAPS
jgi:hypothetical protein